MFQFLVLAVLIAVAVADTAYPEYPATYDKPSYDYVSLFSFKSWSNLNLL